MLVLFAMRLIFGMGLMLGLMPRKAVASPFFRVQMLIFLGLSVLATLILATPATSSEHTGAQIADLQFWRLICAGMIAGLSFLGSLLWTLERRRGGTGCLWGIVGLSAIVLGLEPLLQTLQGSWIWGLLAELSSAAVLGGAMTAMLLGHSYLTAPTMSIAPLSWLNSSFGVAVVFRGLLSIVCLLLAWGEIQGLTPGMWLSLRWLAGIIGPLVVCGMVFQILKFKNTQAATGVLFVGVILTFIGELSSSLLLQELHLPL